MSSNFLISVITFFITNVQTLLALVHKKLNVKLSTLLCLTVWYFLLDEIGNSMHGGDDHGLSGMSSKKKKQTKWNKILGHLQNSINYETC